MKVADELTGHLRAVDELVLLPGNPRQGDVGAISQSLERFGQLKPIVVDEDGVILAGNHTYLAACALGWTHVAAVTADELKGTEKSAFALADNRLSDLATYDESLLLDMIDTVQDETPDLSGIGYEVEYVDDLRRELDQPLNFHTADERYTPAWVFEAMNVRFDVDLAAPPGGVDWIPADKYFTKEDNALIQDWNGLIAWCNPPFSMAADFGRKYLSEVTDGVWLGPVSHSTDYVVEFLSRAYIWIPREMEFHLEGGPSEGIAFPIFLAGLGDTGETALRNLAVHSPDAGVLLKAAT